MAWWTPALTRRPLTRPATCSGANSADGSWAQLPKMDGDAYATGTALMALRAAGLATDDPAYRKGAAYLLRTQKEDGAWIVPTCRPAAAGVLR